MELILPALGEELEEAIRNALRLEEVPDGTDLNTYRSALVSNLTVVTSAPGVHIRDPDPIVTRAVRERLTEKNFAGLRLLALQATAGAPSRLAAQRHSDAVVLVVTKGRTHGDRIAQSAAEFRSSAVPLLGVITVPPGRRSSAALGTRAAEETRDGGVAT